MQEKCGYGLSYKNMINVEDMTSAQYSSTQSSAEEYEFMLKWRRMLMEADGNQTEAGFRGGEITGSR